MHDRRHVAGSIWLQVIEDGATGLSVGKQVPRFQHPWAKSTSFSVICWDKRRASKLKSASSQLNTARGSVIRDSRKLSIFSRYYTIYSILHTSNHYTLGKSMTTLPIPNQPPIIIRHRGQKPSTHRHQRSRPKPRIIQQHHTAGEMEIHQILHRLHSQHGDETHTRRSPKCQSPGEFVHSTSEEDSLQKNGRGDSTRHCTSSVI